MDFDTFNLMRTAPFYFHYTKSRKITQKYMRGFDKKNKPSRAFRLLFRFTSVKRPRGTCFLLFERLAVLRIVIVKFIHKIKIIEINIVISIRV